MRPTYRDIRLLVAVASALLLSACGDSATTESGGGAGDPSGIPPTPADSVLIQPFVGVYDLQDEWNGIMGDQAFLVIREPGTEGTAEAVLIDFDDDDNCVPDRTVSGEVRKDPFSDRIFMDDIPQFDRSELFILGDMLTVEFVDLGDINNDNNTNDVVQVQAMRLGITEIDLGEPC